MAVKKQESHLNFDLTAELQGAIIGAQTPAALTAANKAGAFGYDTSAGFLLARGASSTRYIPWEDATPANEFILNADAATLADRKGLVITANGVYVRDGNSALVPFLAGNVIATGSVQSIDPTNGHKVAYKANTAATGTTDYTIEAAPALPTVKSARMVDATGKETFEVVEGIPTYANDAARVTAGYKGIWQDPNHVVYKAATIAAGSVRHLTTDDIGNMMSFRGTFDASAGNRPDQASVTNIQAGDVWIITTPGTLPGIEGADQLAVGDFLIAIADGASSGAQYAGIETNTNLNMSTFLAWENQTINLAGTGPVVATYTILTNVRGAEVYDSTGRRKDTLEVRIASATTVEVDGNNSLTGLRVLAYGSV